MSGCTGLEALVCIYLACASLMPKQHSTFEDIEISSIQCAELCTSGARTRWCNIQRMEDLLLLIAFTASFLSPPQNFSPWIVWPHIVSLDQYPSHSYQYLFKNKQQSQLLTFVILNPCGKTKTPHLKFSHPWCLGQPPSYQPCCLFPSKLT